MEVEVLFCIMMIMMLAFIAVIILVVKYTSEMDRALSETENALENAEEIKHRFLIQISHDMKTPMNGILGMTDKALLHIGQEKEMRDCLTKIQDSGLLLMKILDDILDASRMEGDGVILHPEPYSMGEFYDFTRFLISHMQEKRQFAVQMDDALKEKIVSVDKKRFQQIFLHLLSNAVKYTLENGKVSLLVKESSFKEEGSSLHLCCVVEDDGIGMSKEFQAHLFEPFSQETHCPYTNGSGLGMSLVKHILDQMGGTIQVESEKGVGTKFIVSLTLPVLEKRKQEEIRSQEKVMHDYSKLRNKNILLCEDHPLNREIVVNLLKRYDMKVVCAENGKVGVDTFAGFADGFCDAVLMDIRMPVMNGMDAAKSIRSLNRKDAKTIPIIALTANSCEDAGEKASGMNAHLAKPINPEMFYQTLEKLILKT